MLHVPNLNWQLDCLCSKKMIKKKTKICEKRKKRTESRFPPTFTIGRDASAHTHTGCSLPFMLNRCFWKRLKNMSSRGMNDDNHYNNIRTPSQMMFDLAALVKCDHFINHFEYLRY